MSLEQVKRGLKEELERKKSGILKEANQEKEKILSDAEYELKKYRAACEEKAETTLRTMEKRETASAKLNAKYAVLNAKKSCINIAFEKALEKIASFPEKQRKTLLSKLLKNASGELKIGKIHCSAQDKKLIKGYLVQEKDISGGIICESKDGNFMVDLTLDTLLGEINEKNLKEIASMLFGKNAKA